MKIIKNHAVNIVGIAIMLFSLIFIAKAFLSFDIEFSSLLSPKYALFLGISLMAATLAVITSAFGWKVTIEFFSGNKVIFQSAFHIYAKSNLGKYLPGKVGNYVGRQLFGASMGMSQTQLAVASIFEVLYTVTAALLLSLVSARNEICSIIGSLFPAVNILLIISAGIVLCISMIFLFRKNIYLKEILMLIKTKDFWWLLLKTLLVVSVNFLMVGFAFVLIVGINAPITEHGIAVIFAAFVVSWLIGFTAPGIPGGIGVREAVLTLMLSHLYSEKIILTAAVFQRLTMVGGDVMAWAICAMLIKLKKLK